MTICTNKIKNRCDLPKTTKKQCVAVELNLNVKPDIYWWKQVCSLENTAMDLLKQMRNTTRHLFSQSILQYFNFFIRAYNSEQHEQGAALHLGVLSLTPKLNWTVISISDTCASPTMKVKMSTTDSGRVGRTKGICWKFLSTFFQLLFQFLMTWCAMCATVTRIYLQGSKYFWICLRRLCQRDDWVK